MLILLMGQGVGLTDQDKKKKMGALIFIRLIILADGVSPCCAVVGWRGR